MPGGLPGRRGAVPNQKVSRTGPAQGWGRWEMILGAAESMVLPGTDPYILADSPQDPSIPTLGALSAPDSPTVPLPPNTPPTHPGPGAPVQGSCRLPLCPLGTCLGRNIVPRLDPHLQGETHPPLASMGLPGAAETAHYTQPIMVLQLN